MGIDSKLLPAHVQAQLLGQQKAAIKLKAGYTRPTYKSPVSDAPIDVTVRLQVKLVNESNGSHGNFHARRRRTEQERKSAGIAVAFASGFARSSTARYVVTMTRIVTSRGKFMDEHDGLRSAFKHYVDGVADALEIDDGSKRIEWKYDQERGDDWGVRIWIRSV